MSVSLIDASVHDGFARRIGSPPSAADMCRSSSLKAVRTESRLQGHGEIRQTNGVFGFKPNMIRPTVSYRAASRIT